MADDITNAMLLEHIQAMKNELLQRISGVEGNVNSINKKLQQLQEDMSQGFDDARKDRQALRENLEETMRVQGAHTEKLARV